MPSSANVISVHLLTVLVSSNQKRKRKKKFVVPGSEIKGHYIPKPVCVLDLEHPVLDLERPALDLKSKVRLGMSRF